MEKNKFIEELFYELSCQLGKEFEMRSVSGRITVYLMKDWLLKSWKRSYRLLFL